MERFFNIADANLADYLRLTGETDDAPRFSRAIAAAPNGVLLRSGPDEDPRHV